MLDTKLQIKKERHRGKVFRIWEESVWVEIISKGKVRKEARRR
jgi:protein associated with RNAse G/E